MDKIEMMVGYDINFYENTISITKTRTAGITKQPKTKSSIRTIDILSQCEYYLKEQRKLNGLSKKVFSKNGKEFHGSLTLREKWKKLLISHP